MSNPNDERQQNLEVILNQDHVFHSPVFNDKLSKILKQVCRIEVKLNDGNYAAGTGFLIGPDLVITNYHVVEFIFDQEERKSNGKQWAEIDDVTVRFDYQLSEDDIVADKGMRYGLHLSEWMFDFSPMSLLENGKSLPTEDELDYAILKLEQRPGDERDWIHFQEKDYDFKANTYLIIPQYPEGRPLCYIDESMAVISLNENNTRLRHRVNTKNGSSGSPCFNKFLELVALHCSKDTAKAPEYNEAIPIMAIKNLLYKREKLDQIQNPAQVKTNDYDFYPPYTTFIGREQEFRSILKFIEQKANQRKNAFAFVHGMPGVGKTSFVAELYNNRTPVYFQHKIWLAIPESGSSWQELLLALGSRLNLSAPLTSSLLNYLDHVPCLFILDGIEKVKDDKRFINFIKRIKPQMASAIVLTSREQVQELIENQKVFELSPLPYQEAKKLFLQSWGKEGVQLLHDQTVDVKRFLKLFENLPMPITLLGRQAKSRKLDQLGDLVDEVRNSMNNYNNNSELAVKNTLAAIDINYRYLPGSAKKLLDRLALFPDSINNVEIKMIASVPPKISDYSNALGKLIEVNLISTTENQKYKMHSVIRQFTNQHLNMAVDLKELKTIVGKYLLLRTSKSNHLLGLIYLFQTENWSTVIIEALKGFGFRENSLYQSEEQPQILKARACLALSNIYYEQRSADQAPQNSIDYALMGKAAIEGVNSLVAQALRLRFDVILTFAYYTLNEPEKEVMFQNVKDCIVAYHQSSNFSQLFMWEIAQAQMLCGVIDNFWRENFDDAEKNTEASLFVFEQLGDQMHTLLCLSNLGSIFCSQGRYTESVQISNKILALENVVGVEGYYLIAVEYVNIVDALTRLGEYSLARERARQGIRFCEVKDEIGAYTMLLINAARVECEIGNIVQAKEMLMEAENRMGPVKPPLDEALLHSTWSYIYQKTNKKRAIKEVKEVLDRFKKGEDIQIDEIIERMLCLRDQLEGIN